MPEIGNKVSFTPYSHVEPYYFHPLGLTGHQRTALKKLCCQLGRICCTNRTKCRMWTGCQWPLTGYYSLLALYRFRSWALCRCKIRFLRVSAFKAAQFEAVRDTHLWSPPLHLPHTLTNSHHLSLSLSEERPTGMTLFHNRPSLRLCRWQIINRAFTVTHAKCLALALAAL